jgi:hypothetical protein
MIPLNYICNFCGDPNIPATYKNANSVDIHCQTSADDRLTVESLGTLNILPKSHAYQAFTAIHDCATRFKKTKKF